MVQRSTFAEIRGKLIGVLLLAFASFPQVPSDACKIGNVFPEYFYDGLLHVAFDAYPLPSFEEMERPKQEALCSVLATKDRNGLMDEIGNLLFDIECLKRGPLCVHKSLFSLYKRRSL